MPKHGSSGRAVAVMIFIGAPCTQGRLWQAGRLSPHTSGSTGTQLSSHSCGLLFSSPFYRFFQFANGPCTLEPFQPVLALRNAALDGVEISPRHPFGLA